MLSTQRLLIMIMMINLIVAVATEITANPTLASTSHLENTIQQSNEYSISVTEEADVDVMQRPDSPTSDPTPLNTWNVGGTFISILIKGLVPWPIWYTNHETIIEEVFAWSMGILQAIMYIIVTAEIYLVIKNRKST